MDKYERIIRISYDLVTPESAEQGDVAERGFLSDNDTRYSIAERDEAPVYPMFGPASAAEFLLQRGAVEPSSSTFDRHASYSTEGSLSLANGEVESRHYHLSGFPEDELKAIYAAVAEQKTPREKAAEARRRLEADYTVDERGCILSPESLKGVPLHAAYLEEVDFEESFQTKDDRTVYVVEIDDEIRSAFPEVGEAEVAAVGAVMHRDVGVPIVRCVSRAELQTMKDQMTLDPEEPGSGPKL